MFKERTQSFKARQSLGTIQRVSIAPEDRDDN